MRVRHTRKVVGAIAGMLMLGAIGFAMCDGQGERRRPGAADSAPVSGQRIGQARCGACHGPAGEGRPGFAPPLTPITSRLAAAPGGRDYLIDFMLYGLRGEVEIDGTRHRGSHPSFAELSDEEIAAVLNGLIEQSGDRAFQGAEVAARRSQPRSGEEVRRNRPPLDAP
jgi:mono/diheme cytochrome c family protein